MHPLLVGRLRPALYLATWVIYAASNPRAYALFQGFNTSIVGRLILGAWLFCGFYHLCNGIRHLGWDLGYGYSIPVAYRSGYAVVAISVLLTAATWGLAYVR